MLWRDRRRPLGRLLARCLQVENWIAGIEEPLRLIVSSDASIHVPWGLVFAGDEDSPARWNTVTNRQPTAAASHCWEFQGTRILAGYAHPLILEKAVQALRDSTGRTELRLDAFKLAHHGSKASLTNSLLKLVKCRSYLISTIGSYFGHPDDEAIARVIRHGGRGGVLYFNYRQKSSRL
jgi:hypothetical protein